VRFTPGSSWINQVERWFGLLTEQLIRRGVHTSVVALENDVRQWIKNWNDNPKPFVWTKTAEDILQSLRMYGEDRRRGTLVFVALVDNVACRPEHAAQVDNLLFVDVLVLRLVEDLRLAADRDLEPAIVSLVDLTDVLQQGQDSVPLHVVAGRMLKDLRDGVAVLVVEVCRFGHHVLRQSSSGFDLPSQMRCSARSTSVARRRIGQG